MFCRLCQVVLRTVSAWRRDMICAAAGGLLCLDGPDGPNELAGVSFATGLLAEKDDTLLPRFVLMRVAVSAKFSHYRSC